jgi:serine/threonine protein kinase/Tol biopolymer transport system component
VTDNRWARLEALYHAAVVLPATDRSAFLDRECPDDPELRRELQSLLEQPTSGGLLTCGAPVMLGPPPTGPSSPQRSFIGERIGPYEVVSLLGVGGMGEVYRARDTRLGRDVALKVLPAALTTDQARLARFQREARLLAALNHPNIATIHGIEDAGGHPAIVMELVEGKTLAERLATASGTSTRPTGGRRSAGKRLPVGEALAIAKQLSEALEAAHEQGIIHRDLKPANIKITPNGLVKVLDFGIAKTLVSSEDAPTGKTAELTDFGVIVGTAAYMSPEQARGEAVDKRTDIWAFGCVLFELLTGHAAFYGRTIPDTLSAVLEREPNWDLLPATTLPSICRLLRRCLDKDPKRRVRDIGDAAIELSDAITPPANIVELQRPVQRWVWGLLVGFVLVGLALGWAIARLRQPIAVESRVVRLTVDPPAGTEFGVDTGMAISPDGRMLAFVTGSSNLTKLWIRPLNSLSARELPGTDGATFPFWSPDGRSLGFFAGGKLKRIEVAGGLPTVICDVGSGRGGTWNEDGVLLFNSVNDGPLLRVAAAGGIPVPFTTVDKARGENSHRWPQFLPGGRRFLYFVRNANAENSGVYLGSLDGPQEKIRVLRSPTNAVFARDRGKPFGHLLWVRDGTLMAQPFDLEQGKTTSEPSTVAEAVGFGGASRLGAVSASSDGTILYGGTAIRHVQLTWFDREGKPVGTVGQPGEYTGLRISPDGKRVAFTRGGDIWQTEFARGIPTRVTFGGGVDPLWSPDSQRIAYWKGGPPNLFSHSTDGIGVEERLIESRDSLTTEDWSPDGRFLLYLTNSNDLAAKTRFDLWWLPMTGNRQAVPYLSTPFHEARGQFSPDGKWVAYTSDESSPNDVYVQRFPSGGGKVRVSSKGGDWVRWPRDGREMFYIAADRRVMSVNVRAISGSLDFGTPQALFMIPVSPAPSGGGGSALYTYDVMPNGQRFLAAAPAGDAASPSMTVILNWTQELNQRVATR